MSKRIVNRESAYAALSALHPVLAREAPVPLKCGIRGDLVARYPAIPARTLHALLGWLTSRQEYLAACQADAPRFGLDGEICGAVTEAQALHAAGRIRTNSPPRPSERA